MTQTYFVFALSKEANCTEPFPIVRIPWFCSIELKTLYIGIEQQPKLLLFSALIQGGQLYRAFPFS